MSRRLILAQVLSNSSDSNLIIFIINGVEYLAEQGMTWTDFVNSDYNQYDFRVHTGSNCVSLGPISQAITSTGNVHGKVKPSDVIISGHTYYLTSAEPV